MSTRGSSTPSERENNCVADTGLRFDGSVPKETIRCSAPQLAGPDARDHEVISENRACRLAQRSASHVVLEYVHPALEHWPSQRLSSISALPAPWPGCIADVSFVAGRLVEELVYH